MHESLHETLSAAATGDPVALNSLFGRHLPNLRAFIRMKAGRMVKAKESVNDLVQSVCREVLEDFDQFEYRGEAAFRQWLFLHATRKILERHRYHRAAKRDAAREAPPRDLPEDEATTLMRCYATFCTPSRRAAAREELHRIESAIAELPENQRDALALSRMMGLSYKDAAEQLDCTPAAVRGLVARGLARLSDSLTEPETPQ